MKTNRSLPVWMLIALTGALLLAIAGSQPAAARIWAAPQGGPTATPTDTPPTDTPLPTDTVVTTDTPAPTDTPATTDTPTPAPTPTTCPNPFVDINGNVFYQAIMYLYCRGVVNGIDSTHFGPQGTTTRGQFAKIIVLGFNITPLTTPNCMFSDVPHTYFAYYYICVLVQHGIMSGYDQATCTAWGLDYPCFGPNRPITRAQLVKVVVLTANYALVTPSDPTYCPNLRSHWAFVYIYTADVHHIINGYYGCDFRPNLNIRRDEAAQIVYKAITTP